MSINIYLAVPREHVHAVAHILRAGLTVTTVDAKVRTNLEKWCDHISVGYKPLYLRKCDGCGGKIMLGPVMKNGLQRIEYSCTCDGQEPLGPEWSPIEQSEDEKHWVRDGRSKETVPEALTPGMYFEATSARDAEIAKLRAALEGVLEVCVDRQAFVMQGPRAFAKAEQIALAALGRTK